MRVELEPLNIREGVSVLHSYFQTCTPSPPNLEVLVVRFTSNSQEYVTNADAHYMDAMIRAGIAVWDPAGVIVDLRKIAYEWGDAMTAPLAAGTGYFVDNNLPIATLVSDLNREGLTSLVRDEMDFDPASYLFESTDSAVAHIEAFYPPAPGPGETWDPNKVR